VGIVSPAEADAIVLEGNETMVGDRDAVGVTENFGDYSL
jgi:hypothetical protein